MIIDHMDKNDYKNYDLSTFFQMPDLEYNIKTIK